MSSADEREEKFNSLGRTMYVSCSKYIILLMERPRGMLDMDVALSQTPKCDGRGKENASGKRPGVEKPLW